MQLSKAVQCLSVETKNNSLHEKNLFMKTLRLISLSAILLCFFQSQLTAQHVTGKGNSVTETIDLPTITGIGLGISADVYVTQGSTQSVKVKGQKNIIDNLKHKTSGGSWNIEFKSKTRNYEKLEIWITMAKLENISIGGSGSIKGQNSFNCEDLDISIGGSGDVHLNTKADDINVSIGGSGEVFLAGSADELKISIGGSGDVEALDMKVRNCDVSSAGSGDIKIHVTDNLNVSMVGSGDVRYKGDPKVKSSVIGSGDVEQVK